MMDKPMVTNERALHDWLCARGADSVAFVGIARRSPAGAAGVDKAVLFALPLSRAFVRQMVAGAPAADEFLRAEAQSEALADELAAALTDSGFVAHSQSEAANAAAGRVEAVYADAGLTQGVALIPQKTLANWAGWGFVGKNNLFVHRRYGCAFAMCSVLTNAPVAMYNERRQPVACGTCAACKAACLPGALHGRTWTEATTRADLMDVGRCRCPLACMMACPFTRRYAGL